MHWVLVIGITLLLLSSIGIGSIKHERPIRFLIGCFALGSGSVCFFLGLAISSGAFS